MSSFDVPSLVSDIDHSHGIIFVFFDHFFESLVFAKKIAGRVYEIEHVHLIANQTFFDIFIGIGRQDPQNASFRL